MLLQIHEPVYSQLEMSWTQVLSPGRAPLHVQLCGLRGQAALNLAFLGKLLCLSCLNLARESPQNRFGAGSAGDSGAGGTSGRGADGSCS